MAGGSRASTNLSQDARRAHLAMGERSVGRAGTPPCWLVATIMPISAEFVLGTDLNRSEAGRRVGGFGLRRGAFRAVIAALCESNPEIHKGMMAARRSQMRAASPR